MQASAGIYIMRTSKEWASPIRQAFISERGVLGFAWVGGALLFVALTGLLVWLLPFSVGAQMAVLFHTALGLLVLVPFVLWQLSHWLATRKAPRKARKISAYIGFWLLAISTMSGLVITWQALFAIVISHGWAAVHLWTGALALPFLLYHALPHPQESAVASGPLVVVASQDYGPARRQTWKLAFSVAAVLGVLLAAGTMSYRSPSFGNYQPPPSFKAAPGPNPFAPSHAETETGGPVAPQTIANSRSCGTAGCHTVIYDEWRASAHRWSQQDEFFQEVRSATTEVQGIQSTEKCGGCHAPVSMLSGYKDPRLGKDIPGYKEGDSCIVCHAVRRVDERGIGSYVLGIPKPYLCEYSGARAAVLINHFLIRVYPAQHDRDYNLKIARQAESCAPCHKEFDMVGKYPAPLQVETQYDDWKNNKWNTDPDTAQRLRCQQCHMHYESVARRAQADPYDLKVGLGLKYRSHRFAAANQDMPLAITSPGAAEQVRAVEKWLKGERLVPEIQKVWPRGPVVPIEIKAPASARPGEMLDLQLALTNKKAGHSFPTGPLNVVRVWIELDVRDQAGKEVFHSGGLDAENHVEAGSYVLRPIAITEGGQSILTPDVWHPKGPNYRPAIPPGKAESFEYRFRVPRALTGPLVVNARLRYRKANQFFMDAVYPHQHRAAPITDISSNSAKIVVVGNTASSASVSVPRPPRAQPR